MVSSVDSKISNPIWASSLEGPERVDAIIAALEPPVTRKAVAALAEKARTAAETGPPDDRAAWREIAAELARRIDSFQD